MSDAVAPVSAPASGAVAGSTGTPPWSGRLPVVGIGLAGRAGMSPRGRRLLEAASVVVGTDRQLELADVEVRAGAGRPEPAGPVEQVPAQGRMALAWNGRMADLLDRLTGLTGETAVLLASGDPNLYGIGASLAARFGTGSVDIEPAVSSLQLALARAGVPLAGTALLSVLGRPLAAVGPARFARRVAILTDPENNPQAVARALLGMGVEAAARAVLAERLGAEDERVREGTLGALPPGPHDPLSVLVVERAAATGPGAGRDESEYRHRDRQVTKAEVRAVSLAALDLAPEDVVWDVGAGSGSVAIEAGRQAHAGGVYAVERDPAQVELLRINLAVHAAWNVEVVEGEAPAVFESLPDPDAVFLGGGGARVAALARAAVEALARRRTGSRRLPPGTPPGRLVANFATVESVSDAARFCRDAGLAFRVSQLQVSRARDVGGRMGFAALNPVFVLSAEVARG